MPFGWERVVDENGKVLYVDHENKRTTYIDPRLAFAIEEKEHPNDFRQKFDGLYLHVSYADVTPSFIWMISTVL